MSEPINAVICDIDAWEKICPACHATARLTIPVAHHPDCVAPPPVYPVRRIPDPGPLRARECPANIGRRCPDCAEYEKAGL